MTTTQNKSSIATQTQLHLATSCPRPGATSVAVAGEVDMATAPALRTALLDALNLQTPVVLDVDLSACTFLDCSGIRVLVAVHAAAHTKGCQNVDPPPAKPRKTGARGDRAAQQIHRPARAESGACGLIYHR